MTALTVDGAFDRINKHRALAELVVYNRNWLPWWIVTAITGDFCDQAERYLRGEGLPPLPVRLWWAYRHWKFKRAHRMTAPNGDRWKRGGVLPDQMQRSQITGDMLRPNAVIPLAPGQTVKFIPVHATQDHEIEVTDASGARRKIRVTPQMLRDINNWRWDNVLDCDPETRRALWHGEDGSDYEIDAKTVTALKRLAHEELGDPIPAGIGSYPRPNCPKCHTPGPELGTPLDNGQPSGWGDSFYTCTNWKCRHKWLWRKVFPLLEENTNREGTKTGAKLRGTDTPFYLVEGLGLTVQQVNDAVRKFANVAGINNMGRAQQKKLARIIQGDQNATCNFNGLPLAKVTNHAESSTWS